MQQIMSDYTRAAKFQAVPLVFPLLFIVKNNLIFFLTFSLTQTKFFTAQRVQKSSSSAFAVSSPK